VSRSRRQARLVLFVGRAALGSAVGLAVLLIGGALPASSAPVVTPARALVPLRVQDPLQYKEQKAAAEHRYELWRQDRGLAPQRAATGSRTVISGSLNAPGITDAADPILGGTPSDSTGAIGPSNYVEFINSEIAVYGNTNLSAPTDGPLAESTFVGDLSASTCDVQIEWDQEGQRWLYAALDCGENPNSNSEAFYFGWSKTADPGPLSSNWCQYKVGTNNSVEDYPKLGHDNTQIIIGTNAFNDVNGHYVASHIWVYDKPANGDTSCPTSGTELATQVEANAVGFTPVPANIADSSATGYVTDIADDQAHFHVYAIGRDAGNHSVVQSTTTVAVPAFAVPATVPQPGTTDEIDSSDTRLTQSVAVTDPATGHEGIWTQHTVAGAGGGPSVVRWYELTPGASTPRQMGTVTGPNGSFAFNGAISPTKDGTSAAIFYNSGSSTQLVDMRVQDRRSDTPLGSTFEDLRLATSSFEDSDLSCPTQTGAPDPCRWGDYAGASPDPSNSCLVWGTSMLTATAPDPIFGTPQWGTQNAAVNVCGVVLAVSRTGTGAGLVTSSVGGISCGSVCSHAYGPGSTVTLTASPSVGSSFAGWSGACSGTGSCTVTMSQARSVTATFTLLSETLSVTTSGSGSGSVTSIPTGVSCGSTCSHAYTYGTTVTLTATAAANSTFSGWSGACSGAATCAVTMNQTQPVSATFTLKPVCVVPKLKGKTLRAAKRALGSAHCRSGKVTRKFSKVKKGRVISQRPRPGKHLPAGTKVSLALSKGKKR